MSDAKDSATDVGTYNVEFSGEALRQIQELAKQSRKTPAELITEGLALAKWYTDVTSRGNKVAEVIKGGTAFRPLVLPK